MDRPPFCRDRVTDEQEAARLLSFARPLTLSPRACLWHAGDRPDLLVMVERGLLRAKVVLADGREYIKEFYWEGDEFLDFHHLLSGEPARYSVEALEPCRLLLFNLADLRTLSCWPAWYQHLLAVQLRIKEEKELLLLTERVRRLVISTFCAVFPRWRPGCPITRSPLIWASPPSA